MILQTIERLNQRTSPFFRGSIFYGSFWGVTGIYQPFIFLYFAHLGMSSEKIGILSSVLSICVILVTPLVSRLADHHNQRTTALAICLTGYAIMLMILPIATDFLPLVLVFLVLNVFNAPIGPLSDSLIVKMSTNHHLNFGGMRFWGSLVFAIVTAVFGWIWEKSGFQWMFFLGGGLMLLVAGSSFLLEEDPVSQSTLIIHEDNSAAHNKMKPWQDHGFILLLIALFLLGASFAMVWTFDSLFVAYLGGTRSLIGGMRGLSALAELPPMLFSHHILRRLGNFKTLLSAFFLLAISDFGYWQANGTISILFVNILKGFGFGLFFIAIVVIIDKRAPHGLASTYQGLSSAIIFGLAPIFASPLGGWVYTAFAPRTVFLVSGILVVLAILVLIPAFGNETTA